MRTPDQFKISIVDVLPYMLVDGLEGLIDQIQFDENLPYEIWDAFYPLACAFSRALRSLPEETSTDAMRVGDLLGWGVQSSGHAGSRS